MNRLTLPAFLFRALATFRTVEVSSCSADLVIGERPAI